MFKFLVMSQPLNLVIVSYLTTNADKTTISNNKWRGSAPPDGLGCDHAPFLFSEFAI